MFKRQQVTYLFVLLLLSSCLAWRSDGERGIVLPEYRPVRQISGVIRVWGSTEMAGILRRWEKGFCVYQGGIRFEDHLFGTASSIAGLYTGVADISLLGRDIWPIETMAFQSVFSYRPVGIQVATGSYNVPKAAYALLVYVNKANPLSKLTIDQLAGIFGIPAEPGRKAIRSWADVGLTGNWSSAPIETYNFDYDNDKAIFFRHEVFAGHYRWRDSTHEFSNRSNANGSTIDSGKLILEALAKDPYGIAVSNPYYANDHVKELALSMGGGEYVYASRESVMERIYPLTRPVWAYIKGAQGEAHDPKVVEFLHYVLSRQGQQDVAADGIYLPLSFKTVHEQLRNAP